MIKRLLTAMTLLTTLNSFAQSDFEISTDKNGSVVYKGEVTFQDLQKEPSFSWLATNASSYTPDPTAVTFLKQYLPQYNMVVMLGTWCEDSQYLVPKLYKVLQQAEYPFSQYKMYGMDREKTAKHGEHTTYNVTLVPTIILTKNNIEIGRIVESARKSIESDLISLIEKDLGKEELNPLPD